MFGKEEVRVQTGTVGVLHFWDTGDETKLGLYLHVRLDIFPLLLFQHSIPPLLALFLFVLLLLRLVDPTDLAEAACLSRQT